MCKQLFNCLTRNGMHRTWLLDVRPREACCSRMRLLYQKCGISLLNTYGHPPVSLRVQDSVRSPVSAAIWAPHCLEPSFYQAFRIRQSSIRMPIGSRYHSLALSRLLCDTW
jgi:hypothetical protein